MRNFGRHFGKLMVIGSFEGKNPPLKRNAYMSRLLGKGLRAKKKKTVEQKL